MSDERHEMVTDNVSANHQFREVAKMIPHEEVDVSKMETTTPTSEKSSAVGNAAAMRETLLRCDAIAQMPEIREYTIVKEMRNLIKKALAAPPRNCDVGTAEEQAKRFKSFCKTHLSGIRSICSTQCPCVWCRSMFHCLTKWAQMTYE